MRASISRVCICAQCCCGSQAAFNPYQTMTHAPNFLLLSSSLIFAFISRYAGHYDDVRCHTLNAICTATSELLLNKSRPCSHNIAAVTDYAVTILLAITPVDQAATAAPQCLVAPKCDSFAVEKGQAAAKKRKRGDGGGEEQEQGPVAVECEWGAGSQRKAFGRAWLALLRCDMSPSSYKRILKAVATHVVPHLNQPLLLADFFTRSYDVGGVVSILSLNGMHHHPLVCMHALAPLPPTISALCFSRDMSNCQFSWATSNIYPSPLPPSFRIPSPLLSPPPPTPGLFFLIHKHNLDYPQFYMKLYKLFEPSILHVRYRARFFSLADLFLRSSMLPAYLAAAFIKRLARLALTAPTPGVCVCASFIFNLLRRHPSCACLLHRGSISMQPADIANAPKDLVKAHTSSRSLSSLTAIHNERSTPNPPSLQR